MLSTGYQSGAHVWRPSEPSTYGRDASGLLVQGFQK